LQTLLGVPVTDAVNSGDTGLGELSNFFLSAFLVLVSEEQDFGSSDGSSFVGAGSGELFEVLAVFGGEVDFGSSFHS
jgi:hypothetical protein